jgi:hypothetical protein
MKTKLLRQIRKVYSFEYYKLLSNDCLYCANSHKRTVCGLTSHVAAMQLTPKALGNIKGWLYIILRRL